MNSEKKRILLQVLLFVSTFLTTTVAGAELAYGRSLFSENYTWNDFTSGMEFSIPLLLFLTAHEFGHYFTALYHKVETSLPYYIPIPPIPFLLNIGTLGAVIRIRSRPASNVQHFDIGISGPLTGFIMALMILFYGFRTLPPAEYIFQIHPEYEQYGLEYSKYVYEQEYFNQLLKKDTAQSGNEPIMINLQIGTNAIYKLFENFAVEPSRVPNAYEIMHYPVLLAGFFALFFTTLNLLPIGQLDGGHIIYGMFGLARHKTIASVFLVLLLFYAGLGNEYIDPRLPNNTLLLFIIGYVIFLFMALKGLKLPTRDTAMYAVLIFGLQFLLMKFFPAIKGNMTWLIFGFIVGRFLGVQHPPSEIEKPLDVGRLILGWIALMIFILCFSPAPIEAIIITAQQ